jgi:hypothetical protein
MKDIIGYANYTINGNGEIYNKKTGRLMKQALNGTGYLRICLTNNKIKKYLLVHRLVYQMFNLKTGETMGDQIDHINGNKSDNSLNNLRPATNQENSRNKGKYKNNKLGHKNITITKNGTFRVEIRTGNGRYAKNFKTLEEAIIDRNIKTVESHGEFANTG